MKRVGAIVASAHARKRDVDETTQQHVVVSNSAIHNAHRPNKPHLASNDSRAEHGQRFGETLRASKLNTVNRPATWTEITGVCVCVITNVVMMAR